ncbi:exported hypothetical protein [uncultured Eubacteriales bacterium]|uniref:Uncharacterized protein n=1 Tax=uncultured Eubacteriales bacterium TaxID=172733 RepID=A0A212J015_9FIRM|nr:exported hypothetical protein [uncultured Eubacteriales bacterium]
MPSTALSAAAPWSMREAASPAATAGTPSAGKHMNEKCPECVSTPGIFFYTYITTKRHKFQVYSFSSNRCIYYGRRCVGWIF